jgi:hypothetical protein
MTFTLLRRFVTQVVIVFVALAAILTSGAPAQSLGDVARQEESRRKATANGKVYTNDDLRGAPAPAASPAQPPAATPAPGPAPADATKPEAKGDAKPATGGDAKAGSADPKAGTPAGKNDEAAWRERRKSIQDALARAEAFAGALQSQINGLTADFAARDDPAQRAKVGSARQTALTELDRVKKEIQQHTKALADLQEEARRAGVPAGWLR